MSAPEDKAAVVGAARAARLARRATPWMLLLAAALVAFISVLSVFGARVVLSDTVIPAASGELLADPVIREAIATRTTKAVFDRVDVDAELGAVLPARLAPLAGPLAAGLESSSAAVVDDLLTRPLVQRAWGEAVRVAHTELVRVLNDEGGALALSDDGTLTLDLAPVAQRVADDLGLRVRVPADAGEITLLHSEKLAQARTLTSLIGWVSWWGGALVALLLAGAVWLALSRRRMIIAIGVAAVAVGALLRVAHALIGTWVTGSHAPDIQEAIGRAYALLTAPLVTSLGNTLLIGVLLILGGLAVGPSRLARTVRRWCHPLLERRASAYGLLAGLIVAVIALHPALLGARWITLILLVAVAVWGVEVLYRQAQDHDAPSAASDKGFTS